MTPDDVRAQIAAGNTDPVYLLEGDDLQARHELALEFETMVDEGLRAFNVQSFYGNEATTVAARDDMLGTIVAAARTLPMMAPRRIVIVHEAEWLLSPKRASEDELEEPPDAARAPKRKGAAPAEPFVAYLEAPEPLTTLVLVAGALAAGRRLVKAVRQAAVAVRCDAFEDRRSAAHWVKGRLAKDGLQIDDDALRELFDRVGLASAWTSKEDDIKRLNVRRAAAERCRSEVEKLALYAVGEPRVTAGHVRDAVIGVDEPTSGPAVGLAIQDGDVRKALREIGALLESGAVPQPVLGQIRWGVSRLGSPARVRRGLDLVLETDLRMKSSAGDPRHLLERLVIELCGR